MKNYINNKKKTLFPESCFSLDGYKYKKINDKIKILNKDFQIFLDNNKNKSNKPKKNYYNFSINKLFRKLVSDSTKQIIKNYQKNFERNRKKFLSAKEIQKYRDKKLALLRLIRNKKQISNSHTHTHTNTIKNNKTHKITNDKNTSMNNISNTFISGKDNNKSYDNKMSIFTNKSMYSYCSNRNTFLSANKSSNISIKNKKFNFKERLFGNKHFNNKSTREKMNNSSLINDLSSNKNNEKDILINSYNDGKNNISAIGIKSDNHFDNLYTKDEIINLNKKINLRNLKLNIYRFENSTNYLPNTDTINNNLLHPYKFMSKKYIIDKRIDRFYLKKKKFKYIFNNLKKRKNFSEPKNIPLANKTQTSMIKEKFNSYSKRKESKRKDTDTKNVINKINNIQQAIKIKKRIIKKEKNNTKSKYIKKMMDYFKNKNPNNEDIDNELKREISTYQKKIGQFIFLDGKYIYTSHLSFFGKGKNFI